MTFAPQPLLDLGALWVSHGGSNLGIVGDASHAATGGYHEGRDDLLAAGVLATDYSVQHPRDVAGLSNAAAAIDFGHDDKAELQAFSVWMVGQCQAHATGWDDVREIIYSPDGAHVWRWSGVDGLLHEGYPNGTGQGDASHLWHTHISYFRDSEFRDKLALVAPYFGGPAVQDRDLNGYTATALAGSSVYGSPNLADKTINAISESIPLNLVGHWSNGFYGDDIGRFFVDASVVDVTAPPAPPVEPTPPTETPEAAYARGYADGKATGIDVGYTAATAGASVNHVITFGAKP